MESTEFKVRIDKQGRLVIPSEARKILGIKEPVECVLTIRGRKILIELRDKDYKKKVEDWYEKMKNLKIEAMSELESHEESRWTSDEYAKKKLGLY